MSIQRLKALSVAGTVSFLFYLSFSKWSLWFLVFPALILLSHFRWASVWLVGGFFSFFLSLLWIRIAMIDYGGVLPALAYALIALLSLFLALVQFGGSYVMWRLFNYKPYVLPLLWTGMEILRSKVPYGGFPWLLLGELSVDMPIIRNYLSAGGVYLVSFILVTLSLFPKLLKSRTGTLFLILCLTVPLAFINRTSKSPPAGTTVAIVQTNVEEGVKLNKERFYQELPRLWSLIENALKHEPDILFLPESALPFTVNKIHSEGKKLLNYSYKSAIVTGLIDIRFSEGWTPYNSVFVIEKGRVKDFYDKVRLLPFGEYVPFPFGFVKDMFGAISGTDYVPGSGHRCLSVRGMNIATPVCFEVSYYGIVRKFSRCADIVAVLTNDGWFRDSDGTHQHMRQARVRAIENRVYVLWVNNTGPSAVISPEGKVIKEIPFGEEGFILHTF